VYKQVLDPISGSLGLSSILAALPLVVLFVLLGVVRLKAQWASLAALATAIIVSLAAYSMPAGQAFDAALEGAVFGLFPIMWIVVNALWIFELSTVTGYFSVLRRVFAQMSEDRRVQVVVIAFCFGALLEALAGFGTPVAICGSILVGLGVSPLRAAAVALVADTAPVAFGGIAIPITTLGSVSGLPTHDLGQMVGRQTPIFALVVPFILIFMTDGRRGLRQAWPAGLVAGFSFGILQFVMSNYVSYQLTDIVASLGSAAAMVALLQVWSPPVAEDMAIDAGGGGLPAVAGGATADAMLERQRRADAGEPLSRGEMIMAFAPYAIITVVLGVTNFNAIHEQLDKATREFQWPGLHIIGASGAAPSSVTFSFNYLTAAGTGLFVSGLITAIVLRVGPALMVKTFVSTLGKIKWAIVVVASVLAIAYEMNLSGQTITLGTWAAGAGGVFALLSPILGWFGTAVTGSDTSSNSLFGALQVAAGKQAHISPLLLAAGNSSGGVMGKMVSPQNLAIGAAAVGLGGKEGDILRRVIGWSVVLALAVGVLVYLQSTSVLGWMVP
jgi:lactate permease